MWSLHWTENPEERDRNPSAPQKIHGYSEMVSYRSPKALFRVRILVPVQKKRKFFKLVKEKQKFNISATPGKRWVPKGIDFEYYFFR